MSKIPTPIYELTKTVKQFITPYLSSKINTWINTLKPNNGILASLDVENLFTKKPVNETVDFIIDNIYNNPSLSPLKINLIYFEKYS